MNLHSFHSLVWREEAGRAVAALIEHCEAQPYAGRIWAWHLCDGLFCEWFHWDEYTFDGLADYSPAAQADFRRWLRCTYHDDPQALARAWGREVDFETAAIPSPAERAFPSHDEFYDPTRDRPVIDYVRCLNEATADSIVAICQAAKRAMPTPKVTCVFYGYQFSNMPRAQLNGHYALRRVLDSPAVDMLACPHSYSYRGEGRLPHPAGGGRCHPPRGQDPFRRDRLQDGVDAAFGDLEDAHQPAADGGGDDRDAEEGCRLPTGLGYGAVVDGPDRPGVVRRPGGGGAAAPAQGHRRTPANDEAPLVRRRGPRGEPDRPCVTRPRARGCTMPA